MMWIGSLNASSSKSPHSLSVCFAATTIDFQWTVRTLIATPYNLDPYPVIPFRLSMETTAAGEPSVLLEKCELTKDEIGQGELQQWTTIKAHQITCENC